MVSNDLAYDSRLTWRHVGDNKDKLDFHDIRGNQLDY